ncbi:MAG: hypothetical protein ACREML_10400, partial [Vulcanimicrobiaceae bacterium]
VYNKADLLPEHERELVAFTQRELSAALGFTSNVFVLSARGAAETARSGSRDRRFKEFVSALTAFLDNNRDIVRERSIARKGAALARRVQFLIALRRHALVLPAKERKETLAQFERLATEIRDQDRELRISIDRTRRDIGDTIDRVLRETFQTSRVRVIAELRPITDDGELKVYEDALERVVARETTLWARAITELLDQETASSAERLQRQVERLEHEILALGVSLVGGDIAIPISLHTAFEVPGITLPHHRVADTGLEILMHDATSLLPRPLRARILRRWLVQTVEETLDKRRGRLRYAARQELERIGHDLWLLAAERVMAAESAVRRGLSEPAQISDSDLDILVRDCERDEARLVAIINDLDVLSS